MLRDWTCHLRALILLSSLADDLIVVVWDLGFDIFTDDNLILAIVRS